MVIFRLIWVWSFVSEIHTIYSTYVIGVLVGGIPAPSGYSPRASPVHSSTLTKPPHTVKSMLAKIDHSRSLRQLVLDAKKVSCSFF